MTTDATKNAGHPEVVGQFPTGALGILKTRMATTSMKNDSRIHRLAVCSWSLQPGSPHDLIAKLQATGIRRVQLALDPLRESPGIWGDTPALFREHGIAIVSGMFGCVGE